MRVCKESKVQMDHVELKCLIRKNTSHQTGASYHGIRCFSCTLQSSTLALFSLGVRCKIYPVNAGVFKKAFHFRILGRRGRAEGYPSYIQHKDKVPSAVD